VRFGYPLSGVPFSKTTPSTEATAMSRNVLGLTALVFSSVFPFAAHALEPIPDKLVALTFDDSVKSHFTFVRPILKRYGFGATFFVTEGFDFRTNKKEYMTWEEIAQLHRDGFEIGNHTRDHLGVSPKTVSQLPEQLEAINKKCKEYGIPIPTSFAYPGNGTAPEALTRLRELGIRFARRGGAPEHPYEHGNGFAYEPGLDHPLLIPSAGDARPAWKLADFVRAVEQARYGRIAVMQFHGVPDREHPWVHTEPKLFEEYMKHLAKNGFKVVALRDLARYVNPDVMPRRWQDAIDDRKQSLTDGTSRDNFRRPKSADELRYWFENMVVHHKLSTTEISAATGMTVPEVSSTIQRLNLTSQRPAPRAPGAPLRVLPFPGGRHPRVSYRDGAIRPQRETKVSVFLPWAESGYVVVDVPEAIWVDAQPKRELLYLAHTDVPTMWTRQGIALPPLEWSRGSDGSMEIERHLPNGVRFGAKVIPKPNSVRMELWLTNGTQSTLRGLRVQNCVMLRDAKGFAALTKKNKILTDPYVACQSADDGRRWIITAWEHCKHHWANTLCPCMHSDPQFPDCPPGETQRLRGWLSFYEGTHVENEFRRIEATGWRK